MGNKSVDSYSLPLNPTFVSGIGVASEQMYGRSAQREVAIKKAMKDIATQFGVKVTSELILNFNDKDKINNPDLIVFSMFTLTGKVLTAKIVHSYYNQKTNELHIHMIADRETLDLF